MSRVETESSGRHTETAVDLAAELLRKGCALDIDVYGESMWPLVRQGDRVRVDPTQELNQGRLAATLVDGRLVVHRVMSLTETHCVLAGDFGGSRLSIPRAQVLGVVTHQWTRRGRMIAHDHVLVRGAGRLTSAVGVRSRTPLRMARNARDHLAAVWRRLRKR